MTWIPCKGSWGLPSFCQPHFENHCSRKEIGFQSTIDSVRKKEEWRVRGGQGSKVSNKETEERRIIGDRRVWEKERQNWVVLLVTL